MYIWRLIFIWIFCKLVLLLVNLIFSCTGFVKVSIENRGFLKLFFLLSDTDGSQHALFRGMQQDETYSQGVQTDGRENKKELLCSFVSCSEIKLLKSKVNIFFNLFSLILVVWIITVWGMDYLVIRNILKWEKIDFVWKSTNPIFSNVIFHGFMIALAVSWCTDTYMSVVRCIWIQLFYHHVNL